MMRAASFGILVIAAIVLASGPVSAEYLTGVAFDNWENFETAEFFIVSDPGNEGPLLDPRTGVSDSQTQQAFLNPEFVASIVNPNYALTTGIQFTESPLVSGLFSFHLAGDMLGALAIDILTWDNGVGSTLTNLTGRWLFQDGEVVGFNPNALQDATGANYNRSAVTPTPSSFALFGIGGLALLGYRRRKARQTQLPA